MSDERLSRDTFDQLIRRASEIDAQGNERIDTASALTDGES